MDHLLVAVLLSLAAWLAMGRSLVAAATLVTLLPFLSLGLSPEEARGAVSTGTDASAYKMSLMMRDAREISSETCSKMN